MFNVKGKVIVITGASSGIGAATARLLVQNGAHVVLGARRLDRLEALKQELVNASGSVIYKYLDVTKVVQLRELIELAVQTFKQVDVIINNAGVMPLSKLEELKIDEWNQMIDVNIKGVLNGIAAGLPVMQKQAAGHFINIASTGAYEVLPTAAVYCATKYAVRAITDGLRQEASTGIRVTLISPGVTESELADHISDPAAREAMIDYRRNALPALAIAEAIVYAIGQPEHVDVNELIVRPTAKENI
ncbi:NADP-dependent 3-hydroxy acid dehydrogenase YdfG [Amphibacillus marinus]|uniref:NADP-dependent 3-hydroxy acid dehydrogenase YdfG n=1 Tax=Amphibacillus marinus TaxID=872970 RepID=A0A1H8RGM5_9BACI|nr:SDR family oxidoreductase [Amphibacillus marinus]SEO65173.1 NADP-dependent 3-hydroxy acid dehydrogenase YdfG [Amphibacillus marinus]